MAKTAAQRQREYRQRKVKRQTILAIPLDAGAVASWLVECGDLPEWDSEDRDAIAAALSRHIDKQSAA